MSDLELEQIIKNNMNALETEEFKKLRSYEFVNTVIDTRNGHNILTDGYIPDSIWIGLEGGFFSNWAPMLIKPSMRLLLVNQLNADREAVSDLAQLGYENVEGYLKGGFAAWKNAGLPIARLNSIPHEDVINFINKDGNILLDVRESREWEAGVLPNSLFYSLKSLEKNIQHIPKDKAVYTFCKGGVRSITAATILHKHGFKNIFNLEGGVKKMVEKGIKFIPK